MISTLSSEKIKHLFHIEVRSSHKHSQLAGSAVFTAFLRSVRLRERLEAIFREDECRAIEEVMLGIFSGAKSMEQVAWVGKAEPFKSYLGDPVSSTQITRILKSVRPKQIRALHGLCQSLGLLEIAGLPKDRVIDLNVDTMGLEKYGKQQGVEVGYIGREQKLAKCYQYQLIHIDRLNTLLDGALRHGATHSNNGFCNNLQKILPWLADKTVRIKADSAYLSDEAIDLLCEYDTTFFIKAPMSESRVRQAASPQLQWSKRDDDDEAEYASYVTNTRAGWQWREVFKRTPTSDPEKGGYNYYCVATNNSVINESRVFEEYNPRANIENVNKELQEDYHLNDIVTQWFAVNDIITEATFLLFQLVSHFKRSCLDKAYQSMRLSTLRELIFIVPGQILSSARRRWLRIFSNRYDPNFYARILTRIDSLRTLLVLAASLDTS